MHSNSVFVYLLECLVWLNIALVNVLAMGVESYGPPRHLIVLQFSYFEVCWLCLICQAALSWLYPPRCRTLDLRKIKLINSDMWLPETGSRQRSSSHSCSQETTYSKSCCFHRENPRCLSWKLAWKWNSGILWEYDMWQLLHIVNLKEACWRPTLIVVSITELSKGPLGL
jgi:hypothetical protein